MNLIRIVLLVGSVYFYWGTGSNQLFCQESDTEPWKTLLQNASEAFDAGNYFEALQNYQRCVSQKRDLPDCHYGVALSYLALKDDSTRDPKSQMFEDLLFIIPSELLIAARWYNNEGERLLTIGMADSAEAAFKAALKCDLDSVEYRLNTLKITHPVLQAIRDAEKDEFLLQEMVRSNTGLGRIYFSNATSIKPANPDELTKAIDAFSRVTERKPDFADAHVYLAKALAKDTTRRNESLKVFKRAAELYYRTGAEHFAQGNWALANENLIRAKKNLGSKHLQTRFLLAQTYVKMDSIKKALREFSFITKQIEHATSEQLADFDPSLFYMRFAMFRVDQGRSLEAQDLLIHLKTNSPYGKFVVGYINFKRAEQASAPAIARAEYEAAKTALKNALKGLSTGSNTQAAALEVEIRYYLGQVYERLGDYAGAQKIYSDTSKIAVDKDDLKAVAAYKEDLDTVLSKKYNEALYFERQAKWEEAHKKFVEIAELDPDYFNARDSVSVGDKIRETQTRFKFSQNFTAAANYLKQGDGQNAIYHANAAEVYAIGRPKLEGQLKALQDKIEKFLYPQEGSEDALDEHRAALEHWQKGIDALRAEDWPKAREEFEQVSEKWQSATRPESDEFDSQINNLLQSILKNDSLQVFTRKQVDAINALAETLIKVTPLHEQVFELYKTTHPSLGRGFIFGWLEVTVSAIVIVILAVGLSLRKDQND